MTNFSAHLGARVEVLLTDGRRVRGIVATDDSGRLELRPNRRSKTGTLLDPEDELLRVISSPK